jgi:hypothetical protein
MKLQHVLIKDNRERICQKILYINADIVLHININILKMKNSGMDVTIESIQKNYSVDSLDSMGWSLHDELYETLVLEFNNKGGEILKRWKK